MATLSNHRRLVGGMFLCGLALTACVSKSKYQGLEAQYAQLQEQRAADQAQIARLQGAIKYTIESDLLFEPGSWQMSDEGKQNLGRLAQKLAPAQENKIVVNGYTDNTPIGPELRQKGVSSNDDLSQKRAESVRQFLIREGVNPGMVSAIGHGDNNPVATNDSAQGRAQNRRVELTLGG